MAYNANWVYDENNYLNPVNNRPQVRINGVDLRSFGLELITTPDILLPPVRERNYPVSNRSGSIKFFDSYNDWSFTISLQVSGNTPFEVHQRKLNFYRWLQSESNNLIKGVQDKEISGLLFELTHNNSYYTRGSVSNSSNSNTITGTDTKFKSYAAQSALFQFNDDVTKYYVESVTSDTELILSSAVSNSHTSSSYRLERRKYLIVNFNGTAGNSALYNGFLSESQPGVNHPYVENISVGFKANHPYWVGDHFNFSFTDLASGDSNYANEEFGGIFLELEGVGNSRLRPDFVFDGEAKKPRIFDSLYSFVTNFDASVKADSLFNDKSVDHTSIFSNYIYTDSTTKTGQGSLFIGVDSTGLLSGTANASSANFTETNRPFSYINQSINYNQGVFSCWINLKSEALTGNDAYVIDFGSNSLKIFYDVSESKITGQLGNSSATSVTTSISANQWYNIRAKWKIDKTFQIFVDNTSSSSVSFTTVSDPSQSISVGNSSATLGGDNQLNGYIEDISVWDISPDLFDDTDIKSGTNSKTVHTDSLIFHSPTDSTSDVLGQSKNHIQNDYRYNVINADTYDSGTREYVLDLHESRDSSTNHDLVLNDRVIIYDETGMFTYGEVTTNTDNNTIRVRKDHFSSDQQVNPPATASRTTYPNPNQIGVHAEFTGLADGAYIKAGDVMTHKNDYNPYSVFSFWSKIDSDKASSYGQSGDDRSYLFHHFKDIGSQKRGWGLCFNDNWQPVLSYMARKDSATKHRSSADTEATGTICEYTHTNSEGGWLRQVEISPSAGDYTPGSATAENIIISIVPSDPGTYDIPVHVFEVNDDSDHVFEPHRSIAIAQNDKVKVTFSNPSSNNVSARILVDEVDTYENLKTTLSTQSMNDDQWHHYSIAFVPNTTTNASNKYHDPKNHDDDTSFVNFTVYLFVDGKIVNSSGVSITNTALGFLEKTDLVFGKNLNNTHTFPGAIKDFRMWNSRESDFIGTTSNISKYIQYLASSSCGSNVDITNSSNSESESMWYRFNDSNNSSNITDHRNDGIAGNNASLVNITNYTTSNIRGVKSFVSNNLMTDGWSDFDNVGSWVTSSRFASTEDRYDNVHEISIDKSSGSQIKNTKALKLTPLTQESPSKSVSQIITLHPSTDDSNVSGTVNYTDTDYVFRCYSKRQATNTSITIESVNSGLFSTHTALNGSSQINSGQYELHELSFALRDSTNSHDAFLINLLFDDSDSNNLNDTLFTGMEIHKNLLKNGSFQQAFSGDYDWDDLSSSYTTATRSTSYGKTSSSNCLQIENTTEPAGSYSDDVISPDFSITNERYYEISFWAKESASSADTSITMFVEDGSTRYSLITTGESSSNLTTTYQRYSTIWQSTATSSSANLVFNNNIESSTVLIADVCVVERGQTLLSKTSQSSASNVNYVSSIHNLAVDLGSGQSIYYDDIVGNKDSGAFSLRLKPNESSTAMSTTSSTSFGQNIVSNGSFELNSLAAWQTTGTVAIDGTTTHTGSYSAKLSSSSTLRQSDLGLSSDPHRLSGEIFIDSGTVTITVGTQDSNGYAIDGTPVLTKTITTTNQWVSISENITNSGNNIVIFTTSSGGVAYVDYVRMRSIDESSDNNVIFSWLSDNNNQLINNDYVRLSYNAASGFVFQLSRGGTLTSLTGQAVFSSNDIIHVSGWYDSKGRFDPKDNTVYTSKLMFNGEIIDKSTFDLSSKIPTYNMKHLFLGAQGYKTDIVSTKELSNFSFDSVALLSRSVSDEFLRSMFIKNEQFRNTNSSLNHNQDRVATDIVSYDFKRKTSELFSGSSLNKSNNLNDFSGKFKGLTVEDDKAVMYISTTGDDTLTDEVKVSYRPHFR